MAERDAAVGHAAAVGYAVTFAAVAAVAAVALIVLGQPLHAQVLRSGAADTITRSVDSVVPRSGAPGTRVTVGSGSMPARTPLRIGFGATTGFEELEMVLTNDAGEFTMTAVVPPWASWERSYRFIAFDVYFRPIALSEPFFATDSLGHLFREGRVERVARADRTSGRDSASADTGVGRAAAAASASSCLALRELSGEAHELVGDTASVSMGARLGVTGVFLGRSSCVDGAVIQVVRVR